MRPFSPKEKNMIRFLLESDQEIYTLMDFIRLEWPAGHFEMSTFQQVARIHLEEEDQMSAVMKHLLEVLSLVKYLEYRGYVSGWDAFPMEDNTELCGEKTGTQKPYFLPDLSVASDILRYGNKKFTISAGLKSLVQRNFKSVSSRRHNQVVRTLIGGFAVLAVIGLIAIYTNFTMIEKGIKVNLEELKDENAEVLRNQQLNQTIIDSLQIQSKQLILMTNQISRNTENTRIIENEVKQQNTSIYKLHRRSQILFELSSKNNEILTKTDSLLNKMSLN